ncbi:MAG: DUF2007 domain-containing protein [Ignavibacteria bacterium]|jgi:hypothetical protein
MSEENLNIEQFHCTECMRIVKEDDKICPYCGADLSDIVEVEEKTDDSDKIEEVVVKIFMNEVEAIIAKEQLESEGIKCYIQSDNYGGMLPALNLSEGVKLIVNEYNYEKAVEVLKAMDMF